MTEGNICMGADEGAEVNSVAGGYCQVGAIVWEVGTLRLHAVHLGYMGTDGLETPVEGSTLNACKRSIQMRYTLRQDGTCSASSLPLAVGF